MKFFFRLFFISLLFLGKVHARPLKLTLEWLLNPHHAPLVIAITQGYFKEEGLEIQLIPAQGSLEGCIQVAAGVADLALTNEPQWLIQQDKGLVLEPVLTLIEQPLEVFISRVPLKELSGKRIGHSSSGVGFSACVLKQILENQGLREQNIIAVHTKYGLIPALLSGQVDAIINAYRTYAAADLEPHRQGFYIYPYEQLGIPLFAAQVIVAHPSVSQETKRALHRALTKACFFLKHHPDQAWQQFIHHYPEMNTQTNQKIWPIILALFKVGPLPCNLEQHKKLKDFLKCYHLIKN